jgi:hypothetical protein
MRFLINGQFIPLALELILRGGGCMHNCKLTLDLILGMQAVGVIGTHIDVGSSY